jgi:flagellar hook-associated protein 2
MSIGATSSSTSTTGTGSILSGANTGSITTSTGQTALTGLASGYNWQPLVADLTQVEAEPEQALENQQTGIQQQIAAYGTLVADLNVLESDVTALQDPSLFGSVVAQVGDSSIASATADSGTALGAYTVDIGHLATSSTLQGKTGIGAPLNATSDVGSLVLSSANFANPVTAGTITVNGQTVTISTSETLQQVFTDISTATDGDVTGSYNPTTDKITLSSTNSSPIVLGSAGDTSNFLQDAQLYTNGTGTVSSTAALGAVNETATLNSASANFATPINDGGNGQGAFTINGVTINYDASTDTLDSVIAAINSSAAGVTASFNPSNNSLTLVNNTTGDVGIQMQDVTGNFLAATGLSGGTLEQGQNLSYSINGGQTLTSESNTITPANSGITGLSVTALQPGTTTVTVGSDTATIQSQLSQFITDYNTVQSLIQTDTGITTSSSGTVTSGVLANDMDVVDLASQLRNMVYAPVSGLSGSINSLSDLGYSTNGYDNTIALTDQTTLTNALTQNLSDVQDLFTNSTNGLATTLNTFLTNMAGVGGALVTKQNDLSQQSSELTTQINQQQVIVNDYQQQLINQFVAMETAESQANSELEYLSKQALGSS